MNEGLRGQIRKESRELYRMVYTASKAKGAGCIACECDAEEAAESYLKHFLKKGKKK